MNILFYTSNSPYSEITSHNKQCGGAEINLRLIAEKFVEMNHNTYYLSVNKRVPIIRDINGVKTYHFPDYYIPVIHKFIPSLGKINDKLIEYQRKKHMRKIIKKEKIDLIHTYSTYPDTFISTVVAKKLNILVIQRIAGRAWYNLLKSKPYLREKIEWTFNNVNMLLFISDFIKDITFKYLHQNGMNVSTPYDVMDIGIDFKKLNDIEIGKTIKEYNLSNEKNIILCVESFKNFSKRQDILIRAIQIISQVNRDFIVVFIGGGNTLKNMKKLSNELGVQHKIRFLGTVPHNDVLSIMSVAKIVVHPTDFEGYSTVIREALALGKAVLCSNIKPLNEFIEDGYNGILANNNPQDFADKLIYLLQNENIRKKIEINAAEFANKHYKCANNIRIYEKLFLDKIKKYN